MPYLHDRPVEMLQEYERTWPVQQYHLFSSQQSRVKTLEAKVVWGLAATIATFETVVHEHA